jgi:hypothetical protein
MKDNIYEKNKKLSPCWELSFNGDCMLNVNFDRKQFEFFPYYISKKREDFIFSNYQISAVVDYTSYVQAGLTLLTNHFANVESQLSQIRANNEVIAIQSGRQANSIANIANIAMSNNGIKVSSPYEWIHLVHAMSWWGELLANGETPPMITSNAVSYANDMKAILDANLDKTTT